MSYLKEPNENNLFYELSPSKLKVIFKQLQLVLPKLIIIHAASVQYKTVLMLYHTQRTRFVFKCYTYNEIFYKLNQFEF